MLARWITFLYSDWNTHFLLNFAWFSERTNTVQRCTCAMPCPLLHLYKTQISSSWKRRKEEHWHVVLTLTNKCTHEVAHALPFCGLWIFLVENLLLRDDFRRCLAPKELSVVIGYPVSSVQNSSFYFSARFSCIKLNLHFVRLEGNQCQNSKIICRELRDCPESVRIFS